MLRAEHFKPGEDGRQVSVGVSFGQVSQPYPGEYARLEPDRELLELTAWEGLEPREVAAVLGIPARTVRTRLSRARARLRDELGDEWASSGHAPEDNELFTGREAR